MPLSVVVLAAGQGKRMHSALPKVLQPLAGRPILGHVLETARSVGADAIHVVYGYGGDSVRERFPDPELTWHLQAEQKGTGHAVDQAMPAIADSDRVLILCGDVPLITPATLGRLLSASAGLAVLTSRVGDPTGYGRVIRGDDDTIVRIVEEKDADEAERAVTEINTGIIAAEAGSLKRWLGRIQNDNAQGEYYLTDVIGLAVADGVRVPAIVLANADEAMGINDRVQLARAERLYQRATAERLLAAGVTLADPERIDVRGTLEVGRDVAIDVGAVFEGDVHLADGCRVGPYCVIRNAALGAGTTVHAHSVIDGAMAGSGCEIGPFARLRPATELADRVKIGNFVETKQSRIAVGTKLNHLTYVGDATIGSNVNIGAGTIVCNYDGVNKHHTTIGDDVFIGSGTELVAPVVIGARSTIGAGSTITKDVPEGKLTLARERQTTIDGWRRPARKQD